MALLKATGTLCSGSGKRALLMTEEFALEQVLRDGCAIDGHERLFGSAAILENGAGHQFLAGTTFTGDQRGGIRGSQLPDELKDLLHRSAAADHSQFVVLLLQLRAYGNRLPRVPGRLQRIGDQLLESGDIEGLEEVIVGPQFHGLDGRLRGAVGRHEDDRKLGIELANAPQGFQTVEPRHADIAEHQVWLHRWNEPEPFLTTGSGMKLNI